MNAVSAVWVIHVASVAWMACKHLEHSIVWELDWIKSMLIMLKICSKPMLPKEAFMPRLVSVFNWQPLHLVNYLVSCGREREKRTKAFVLWIVANRESNERKLNPLLQNTVFHKVFLVCHTIFFFEWLSLETGKLLKHTLPFKTQARTFVFLSYLGGHTLKWTFCLRVPFALNKEHRNWDMKIRVD